MENQVFEIVESALRNAADNLARAKLAFGKMRPDELDKEYGSSGQTCREILEGYQDEVSKIERCLELTKAFI